MRNEKNMNGFTGMNNVLVIVLVPFGSHPNDEMKEYDDF